MEYEEQQIRKVNLLWDKLEETYAAFEDEYPEPEEPVLEEPDEAQVYQERVQLYDRAGNIHIASILEAKKVLANLRKTTAPVARELTSTQKANAIKAKRDKVVKELKGKLTRLTMEVPHLRTAWPWLTA